MIFSPYTLHLRFKRQHHRGYLRFGGGQCGSRAGNCLAEKDEDDAFVTMKNRELAAFLNGFISFKRGKREGPQPAPESQLNNNMVFQKLRIALNLKAEDILAAFELAGFRLSNHELSAFFRKPSHKNYRECKDQVLRNFLLGIQLQLRPNQETTVSTS